MIDEHNTVEGKVLAESMKLGQANDRISLLQRELAIMKGEDLADPLTFTYNHSVPPVEVREEGELHSEDEVEGDVHVKHKDDDDDDDDSMHG